MIPTINTIRLRALPTLLLGAALLTLPLPAAAQAIPGAPTSGDEAAVVATLQVVFDALETGDGALLRSVVAPEVVMYSAETRDGVTTRAHATVDQLAERIAGSPVPLIERMWDPEVTVDGPMASIRTPYDFYAGEDFSHCGIDVATMLRQDDGSWQIVALSWTRAQPPACALHPEGPPEG